MTRGGEDRPRLRFITMAWGEAYIKELFDITLAAALAPGNIPAMARLFDSTMIILTEEGWFERLRDHPAYKGVSKYCPVELRPIDEFITRPDAYGTALTYALFRGFEDLGEDMVNVHLVFLNSDFVLADGSLRTVATRILQGERLILAPSYCVFGDEVTPTLLARRDPDTWALPIRPRELAALTIRHRHNTIRAKTINQRAVSLEWIDQLYYLVDRHTMIGRQFPIAVISMRPEHVVTDMVTFWDYGIVSEVCPTTPRCVIADSDDFLMTELRGRDTARGQIRLGFPSAKQIASKLYRFITADPIELARHTLIVHSGELPAAIERAKVDLERFTNAVLAYLPAPMDYRHHYIWSYHYPTFQKLRAQYLASRGMPLPVDPDSLIEHPPIPSAEVLEAQFEETTRGMAADMEGKDVPSPRPPKPIPTRFVYDRISGLAPLFKPHFADVDPVSRIVAGQTYARLLVVTSDHLDRRVFARTGHVRLRARDVLPADGACADHRDRPPVPGTRQDVGPAARKRQGLGDRQFDVCICELDEADLLRSRELVDALAPTVRFGGSLFLFHWNATMGSFDAGQKLVDADALLSEFPSRLHAARTSDRSAVIRQWDDALAGVRKGALSDRWHAVKSLAEAMWTAFQINRRGNLVSADRLPPDCTSITVELEIAS